MDYSRFDVVTARIRASGYKERSRQHTLPDATSNALEGKNLKALREQWSPWRAVPKTSGPLDIWNKEELTGEGNAVAGFGRGEREIR